MDQLGIGELTNTLNEYELTIASSLVNPEDIDVSWEDIAGLDDVIEELKCTVILPIKMPHLYSYSKLHEPPKGVLLYGPPGVGKTMVAKATAKEAGARYVNRHCLLKCVPYGFSLTLQVHQSGHIFTYRQMVWRITKAGRCRLYARSQNSALHHFH